jgi:type VI secretion system secreted protein VgrG
MPVKQDHREISVTTSLGKNVLLFHSMSGSEQLGRLFEYRVQLLSEKNDIKIADVLGKNMSIIVDLPSGEERLFNGIVTRFCSTGWQGDFSTYEAIIHPWLWLLTRTANCRIFQEKTVLDIVKEVCNDSVYAGMAELDVGHLTGTYEVLNYCVQYRETDFNFVCRLLEHEGIYFFFTHHGEKHTMVLADSYSAHSDIPDYAAVKFRSDDNREKIGKESVHFWSAGGEIQASNYVLNDFDFERAAASTSGSLMVKKNMPAAYSQPAYEQFDYPGGYNKAASGTAIAGARIEAIHGQCEQIRAQTSARGLFPGGVFGLIEHPREDQNRKYLVTSARYEILGNDYQTNDGASGDQTFQCELTAVGKEHNYRPERITPKPFVQGPQTAMVVGKAGEEIWTDKYGRIKVQFHWDREGKDDEKSSCWVRVAQSWSGKRWGTMFIPRIGMEVVVEFLEGDPDRPLVTGCVYNSDTMPPYDLPANQTRSTMKSNSSKGGDGFNEIRFEDKKDSEEIFVQAEKDYNRVVKNNDTLKVGFEKKDKGDQTIEIKNDQKIEVGNDQTTHVIANQINNIDKEQTTHVKENQVNNVDKDQTTHVMMNQKLDVDMDQKIKIGKSSTMEATVSIELKVGASSIKIEPAKITIKSPQILIQADATAEFKAGAKMEINGGAMLTIEGGLVKIN